MVRDRGSRYRNEIQLVAGLGIKCAHEVGLVAYLLIENRDRKLVLFFAARDPY
ncbi:hypothetical protein FHS27_003169 [Rhodopirellula rubra]|uniref:Uncharacterized protein n=1 Tax=Aporhodopirellula rubra TaxID=980271 RepID=A0A7W5DZF1_9BACT|nr:hypothetical protein [Aporhodopirellula rubra]